MQWCSLLLFSLFFAFSVLFFVLYFQLFFLYFSTFSHFFLQIQFFDRFPATLCAGKCVMWRRKSSFCAISMRNIVCIFRYILSSLFRIINWFDSLTINAGVFNNKYSILNIVSVSSILQNSSVCFVYFVLIFVEVVSRQVTLYIL